MNQTEQKIYRAIKRAQFEPYDDDDPVWATPRPFQRRMLARMIVAIKRRLSVETACQIRVDAWGEMEVLSVADDCAVAVSVDTDNEWFVWRDVRRCQGGRFKQMRKGVRCALAWLGQNIEKCQK